MPTQFASGGLEELTFGYAGCASVVDERVVDARERKVHLRHQDMGVIPRVTDDRGTLGVSLHIAAVRTEQQLRRIVTPEQKRMPNRSVAVQALEIQLWRPRVAQLARI